MAGGIGCVSSGVCLVSQLLRLILLSIQGQFCVGFIPDMITDGRSQNSVRLSDQLPRWRNTQIEGKQIPVSHNGDDLMECVTILTSSRKVYVKVGFVDVLVIQDSAISTGNWSSSLQNSSKKSVVIETIPTEMFHFLCITSRSQMGVLVSDGTSDLTWSEIGYLYEIISA